MINEDTYWERKREEYETYQNQSYDWWGGESSYEIGRLYLDDMTEEQMERFEDGLTLADVPEGDLLEVVEDATDIVADSAEWDARRGCVEYQYH